MKIGFMGGSFDPVHHGHLIIAQDVREQLALDRVVLVPAAQAPLKPKEVQATASDRLTMLRLAVQDCEGLDVSELELERGGVSYTIDTARQLQRLHPQDQLFWIIGADQVTQLASWKDIEDLANLLEFVYLDRPGYTAEQAPAVPGLRLHRCQGHLIEISSREIRQRLRDGRTAVNFCPQKVVAYLREKRLYC